MSRRLKLPVSINTPTSESPNEISEPIICALARSPPSREILAVGYRPARQRDPIHAQRRDSQNDQQADIHILNCSGMNQAPQRH